VLLLCLFFCFLSLWCLENVLTDVIVNVSLLPFSLFPSSRRNSVVSFLAYHQQVFKRTSLSSRTLEILFHIHMKGYRSCRNGYSKLISKLVSNEIHMKFELPVLYVLSALKRIVSSKMICSLTNIVFFKLNIEGNGGLLKQKCSNWLFKTGSF
jgi:hypothetical protein